MEGSHFLVNIAANISILLEIRQDMNEIIVGRSYFLVHFVAKLFSDRANNDLS